MAESSDHVATVSNTSPLLNLAIIDRLVLAKSQFGRVLVPPSVVEEFRLEEGRPGSSALREALGEGWITETNVSDNMLARTLRHDLDRGEAEAIALAVEKEANRILLDEREGRRRARQLDLEVTGVLGVLLRAGHEGKIESLPKALDRLEDEAGFWIGDKLREQILEEGH